MDINSDSTFFITQLKRYIGRIPNEMNDQINSLNTAAQVQLLDYLKDDGKKLPLYFIFGIAPVFVALCGLHSIYMGRIGRGLTQMLLGFIVIGIIWQIIDLINAKKTVYEYNRNLVRKYLV